MLIEALKPLLVRLPSGDLHLTPGKPVDLPDKQARKLLTKAQGKVKLVPTRPPRFQPGTWIEWDSPLFGRLRGELLGVHGDGWLEVFHPLTDKLARIPEAWVRQAR